MGIDVPRLIASARLFARIGTEAEDAPLADACARVVAALETTPDPPKASAGRGGRHGPPAMGAGADASSSEGSAVASADEPAAKVQRTAHSESPDSDAE